MKKVNFKIREITIKDAPAFLNIRIKTERETPMMAYRAGERKNNIEQVVKNIQRIIDSKDRNIFVAEIDKKLVGFIYIFGEDMKAFKKTRTIAIAVLRKYWGNGIGSALMEKAISWSRKIKTHRLNLEVFKHNANAIRLYKKFKFKVEGTKKDAAYINKKYIDMIVMGLIL